MAVGTLLAVTEVQAGSERYRKIADFANAFFGGLQSLVQPGHHPKWREVNIKAELPGWRRFPAAALWLQHNQQMAAVPNIESVKANFARFMDERQKASGGPPLSQQEKDQLFDQFKHWTAERPELRQRLESQ